MRLPSASKLQLAIRCPASCSLPYVAEERSSKADTGTKIHACIDALYSNGMDAAIELAKRENVYGDFMMIPSSLFTSEEENVVTESAFEYNPATMEWKDHGRNGRDKFSTGNSFIRGIADRVGLKKGRASIVDWKTGLGSVIPASENWQLIVAALVYRRKLGVDAACGTIVNTTTAAVDCADFSKEFLDDKAEELQRFSQLLGSPEHKTRFSVGENCKYCLSWVGCPAQTTAIERAASVEQDLQNGISLLTVEKAIDGLKAMEILDKKAKEQIRRYIDLCGGSVKLSDGRVYIPAKTEGNIKRLR